MPMRPPIVTVALFAKSKVYKLKVLANKPQDLKLTKASLAEGICKTKS